MADDRLKEYMALKDLFQGTVLEPDAPVPYKPGYDPRDEMPEIPMRMPGMDSPESEAMIPESAEPMPTQEPAPMASMPEAAPSPQVSPEDSAALDEMQSMMEERTSSEEAPLLDEERPDIDPRLKAAMERRDKMQMYGGLLGGFQDLIKATTGFEGSKDAAEQLMKEGQESVDDFNRARKEEARANQQKIAEEIGRIKIGNMDLELTNLEKTQDPNSNESKFAQDMFIQHRKDIGQPLTPDQEANIRGQNARNLHANSRFLQDNLANIFRLRSMELQERRADQADERLELLGKKEGRLTQGQEFKQAEKQEISDKQTETLNEFDTGQNLIDQIREKFQMNNVKDGLGVYASTAEEAKKYIPFVERDPDFVETQALVGTQLADYVKRISGAAVSEQEAQRLARNIPSMDDKPGEFERKLKTFERILKENRQTTIDSFRKQGKDPSGFEAPSKPKKEAPSGDMVRMRIPDGRIKMIPRDKVDAAKKAGAEEL